MISLLLNRFLFRKWVLIIPLIIPSAGMMALLHGYGTDLMWFKDAETIHQMHRGEADVRSKQLYYGFWDHKSGFDFVTVGKSKSKSISHIVEEGIPGIAIIEGFSEDRGQIRERLKDTAPFIQKYAPGSENLFTILTDEPFSEKKNADIMETMVSDAKQILGETYEFAFTFKELAFRDDRKLPQNADWIGINFYPFRHEGGVRSKQDFMKRFETVYQRAREKAPHAKIFIVGQAFYGGKWSQPPAEAPFWYVEFAESHPAIEALLWWKWRSSTDWKGVEDMPEYFESIREAGDRLQG